MSDTLNLVEASIRDIQHALSTGSLTSVDLVARYLRRIASYDYHGPTLNAIPILNPHVFAQAAASDLRRRSGHPVGPLEGIPFTVKDSYKVQGMTAASGSPAFQHLIANEDAFTVAAIKDAGGVLIGRTNMPPVAYGGMQRGLYGRAENPYNPAYLAAAWASGSSNGSAVSTASSMATFGMGEETVSSGRSPASNNALVAYTPSRGWISIRGNWPLYPTCDVVVPHTRTMEDMLTLLEVITARDALSRGDFWRDQPFVKLQEPWDGLPRHDVFSDIGRFESLSGLRVAIPTMFSGGDSPKGARPVYTSPEVQQLLENARSHLERLGAEVVMVPDFPPVTGYEHPDLLPEVSAGLPEDWNWYERGPLVAHGWDQFLRDNNDPNIPSLASVDEMTIWPQAMRPEAELKYIPPKNLIHWGKLAGYVRDTEFYEINGLGKALTSLEEMRRQLCDEYLRKHNCQCFAFPAQGDVAAEDADVNHDSAAHAWRNGVWYSNGNRALRHLGMPSVTVPMGLIEGKGVPMGLTFAGRAYDDVDLLRWATVFERSTKMRTVPGSTPPLDSDSIPLGQKLDESTAPPNLEVEATKVASSRDGKLLIRVKGSMEISEPLSDKLEPIVTIVINGVDVPAEKMTLTKEAEKHGRYSFQAEIDGVVAPPERSARDRTMVPVARDKTMIVVLARTCLNGYPVGHLAML